MPSKSIVFIIISAFLAATAIGTAELMFRTRAMRAEAESMAFRNADLGEYKNKFGKPKKFNKERLAVLVGGRGSQGLGSFGTKSGCI